MILRAEEDVMKKEIAAELIRIARETAMMEEEEYDYLNLKEEARDTMGVYNGPPAGSKI